MYQGSVMSHVFHKCNTQAQNINTRVGLSERYVPDINVHEEKGHMFNTQPIWGVPYGFIIVPGGDVTVNSTF